MSVNLVTNIDLANQNERRVVNSRWKKVDDMVSTRRCQLTCALDDSTALVREVDRIADAARHYQHGVTSANVCDNRNLGINTFLFDCD